MRSSLGKQQVVLLPFVFNEITLVVTLVVKDGVGYVVLPLLENLVRHRN